MCLIVDTLAEGRFLCDVGFGGGNCPRPSVPLFSLLLAWPP
jgi:hypothetical protein